MGWPRKRPCFPGNAPSVLPEAGLPVVGGRTSPGDASWRAPHLAARGRPDPKPAGICPAGRGRLLATLLAPDCCLAAGYCGYWMVNNCSKLEIVRIFLTSGLQLTIFTLWLSPPAWSRRSSSMPSAELSR